MLEVIGVGYGRTGTLSLKAALERLGFGPCYHAVEFMRHPEHQARWEPAFCGNPQWAECSQDTAPPWTRPPLQR